MAPNPQVAKAFRAMRAIGIPEEKVKPVLKELLKLYDKNWVLIEEENYRVLADAILDKDETEAAAEKNKKLVDSNKEDYVEGETQLHDEPDRPLKKLRLEHQNDHAFTNPNPSVGVSELKKPKVEADEVDEASAWHQTREIAINEPQSVQPLARNKGKQPASHESLAGPLLSVSSQPSVADPNVMNRTDGHSSPLRSRDKGKEPLIPQKTPKDFRYISERSSHCVRIREPNVDAGISLSPKQKVPNEYALSKSNDTPSTNGTADVDQTTAVHHGEPLSKAYSTVENASVRELAAQKEQSSQSVVENDKSTDIPAFASEKRIISELVVSPSRSDLGKNITPTLCGELSISVNNCSTLGKPEVHCALQPLNGSVNIQSDAEVAFPLVPRSPPPCNGINSSLHPDINSTENCRKAGTEREPSVFCSTNCHSLVVQKHQPMPDNMNSAHDVYDLARGQEKVVVFLQNDVNSESRSRPSFNYITENVVFQKARVDISIARMRENCCSNCLGDCLLSPTPCVCSNETCGEYAYTLEGLVKEKFLEECISMKREPQKHRLSVCKDCPLERSKYKGKLASCKGHLPRQFIKECWCKCGCSKKCGNRVVQRGINCKLQVFKTTGGKGWGLRTLERLPKGAFVCEYVGEVITNSELYDRVMQDPNNRSQKYSVLLDANWSSESVLKDEEALCLDATHYGNVARFINHRCVDSNLIEIPVEVETPDHHYYHLAFFTTRDVKALEELTWDYGINFDAPQHPISAFKCLCGSKFCRCISPSTRLASQATT